jgi:hypothetical protein
MKMINYLPFARRGPFKISGVRIPYQTARSSYFEVEPLVLGQLIPLSPQPVRAPFKKSDQFSIMGVGLANRGPFSYAGRALSRIFQSDICINCYFWPADDTRMLAAAAWIYYSRNISTRVGGGRVCR